MYFTVLTKSWVKNLFLGHLWTGHLPVSCAAPSPVPEGTVDTGSPGICSVAQHSIAFLHGLLNNFYFRLKLLFYFSCILIHMVGKHNLALSVHPSYLSISYLLFCSEFLSLSLLLDSQGAVSWHSDAEFALTPKAGFWNDQFIAHHCMCSLRITLWVPDLIFFYLGFTCLFIPYGCSKVYLQLFEILCIFCLDTLVPLNLMFTYFDFHIGWQCVAWERPQHSSVCSFLVPLCP